MIVPVCCFTCGKPIGHLYSKYLELVKKYETEHVDLPESRAMSELGLFRLCCRRMILSHQDMYRLIN